MFCTAKWLACFVSSNVNISTDASLGSRGRVLQYLQDNCWLSVNTHPTRCETAILEQFCEMYPGVKDSGLVSA